MTKADVANLLREKTKQYNTRAFIQTDPIQIPHRFSQKGDIEISAFLTADISWGQRTTIINNATRLMEWMDNSPLEFVLNFQPADLRPFERFVHRTFNGDDCLTFLHALQRIYKYEGGLENTISRAFANEKLIPGSGWNKFKTQFFSEDHLPRSRKHLPDPMMGSAAKRMNMFLRWMVRKDDQGVDFGIWNTMKPADLYIPLDVHTSRVGRKLGLLQRKQDDWRAVIELTDALKRIEPRDPISLDYALFGLGAFEKF